MLSNYELFFALLDPIREWNDAIVGTTVAHLGKRHLEQIRVVVPAGAVAVRARELFDDLAAEVHALEQAKYHAALMREQLLPRLISASINTSGGDLDELNRLVAVDL
jgi:type I restriction enzyme S subunit